MVLNITPRNCDNRCNVRDLCYTRWQEVEDIKWNTIFLEDLSGDVAKYTIVFLICSSLLISLT